MYRSYRTELNRELDKKKKKTLIAIGMYLVGRAKLLVAVDTGRLKGSLQYYVDKSKLYYGSSSVGGQSVYYATFQERSQPFIKPALFNNRAEVQRLAQRIYTEG